MKRCDWRSWCAGHYLRERLRDGANEAPNVTNDALIRHIASANEFLIAPRGSDDQEAEPTRVGLSRVCYGPYLVGVNSRIIALAFAPVRPQQLAALTVVNVDEPHMLGVLVVVQLNDALVL